MEAAFPQHAPCHLGPVPSVIDFRPRRTMEEAIEATGGAFGGGGGAAATVAQDGAADHAVTVG